MVDATLYQLADDYVKLRRLIDEAGGELASEEMEKNLDAIEMAVDQKVGNIQRLIAALSDDIEAIEAREAEFARAKAASKRAIAWLNDYCVREMQKMQITTVSDGAWGVYKLVLERVLCVGDNVPNEFVLGPGKPRIDRKALREVLLLGIDAGDSYLGERWTVRRYRSRSRRSGHGASQSASPATSG